MNAAIVPNFIVVDTDYWTLPDLVVGDVPEFATSDEYAAIDNGDRYRPEAVFSALVRFCIRLHKAEITGHLPSCERTTLGKIHEVFDTIAQDGTVSRKFTLVTTMFDALAYDDAWLVLPNLKQRFGPAARRLFDHWIM